MKWRVMVVALVVGAVTASAGLRAAPTGANPHHASSNPFTGGKHGHVMPVPGQSILTLLPTEIQRVNRARIAYIKMRRSEHRIPDQPSAYMAIDPDTYCNDQGCWTTRAGDHCIYGYDKPRQCLKECRMQTCTCDICGWHPYIGFLYCWT